MVKIFTTLCCYFFVFVTNCWCLMENNVTVCKNGLWKNGSCVCFPEYRGESCQLTKCGHGYRDASSSDPKKFSCICDPYWEGKNCELIQCYAGYRIGQFCRCSVGYFGRHCERRLRCIHGRLAADGRCKCDGMQWSGTFCNETRCVYGIRMSNGSCECFGNYSPPLCESCLPGFKGMDCNENSSTYSANLNLSGYRRGSSALALGLVVGFTVMVCFSAIFLYRCLSVLVEFIITTVREQEIRRRTTAGSRPCIGEGNCTEPFLRRSSSLPPMIVSLETDISKPPSYEKIATEIPPPSYQDAVSNMNNTIADQLH